MAPEPLVLKPNCNGCGTTTDLYGSTCKHMTICVPCGKSLVETGGSCTECSLPITRLIREYTVKHHAPSKQFFVGRFHQGIPNFSKRKAGETKWTMQKEGAQGRQLTETQKEKFKLKPWILEDDIGVQQFTGQLEGGQQATYFLLIMSGSDFQALPAGNWYNFHKVAQYKQLTLEEAEEQMKNRRKTADGYQRWMMKAANTGAAAFGVTDIDEKVSGGGGGSGGRRKGPDDDDDGLGAGSDKGEEDEDEEEARSRRLGLKKTPGGEEDGEEPALDLDDMDEEPERGDDWEHEETFTDDDEAVGNDPEERIDQENPEVPPPPEIKQEEEDEEEGQEGQEEEAGGLSKSGKELKKLLGKAAKEDDSHEEEDEEEDEDVDLDNEDIGLSPVLAPTRKEGPKEEPAEITPAKAAATVKPSPPVSASKGKRKAADETKASGGGSAKKPKAEPKSSPASAASKKDINAAVKAATTPAPKSASAAAKPPASQAVTEDEVMRVLKATGPIKSTDLVAKFRSRLRSPEDKAAFAAILKKISRIQKTDGANYIVLRH